MSTCRKGIDDNPVASHNSGLHRTGGYAGIGDKTRIYSDGNCKGSEEYFCDIQDFCEKFTVFFIHGANSFSMIELGDCGLNI